ncbi:MAG: hypothetical protein LC121_04275 [Anaerolineae bacterium]|nr:hypothetical protein [Anaerolineae bacterium]
MTTELNRVTRALLVAFALVALSVGYWVVIEADNLKNREDNARNVIAEQRIVRGTIYDQDGEALATTRTLPSGLAQRVYPHPEAAGATGYYSFKYGVSGIEEAFDRVLRGDDGADWKSLINETLHRPQEGGDVRSTIDFDVQRAITEAMGARSGAAVVAHVPSGRVLGMVSRPGYDPNTLDADWERLTVDAATSPLLNRVTSGLYQPGGALQTVLLSAILGSYSNLDENAGFVLNTDSAQASEPVRVNGLELGCLPGTPDEPLTLAEGYAYGCPGPFVSMLNERVPPGQLWERFDVLGLLRAPELARFRTVPAPPIEPLDEDTLPEEYLAAATGQGALTVTPLHMLQVVAAVANQGNGIPLHIVDAVRAAGEDGWTPVEIPLYNPAILRADVAEVVRLTMLQAAAQSRGVRAAQRGDLVLYGHTGVAYAGPDATPYSWFLGFVDQTQGDEMTAIAAVVVLEGEADPAAAAVVAGDALAAAANGS